MKKRFLLLLAVLDMAVSGYAQSRAWECHYTHEDSVAVANYRKTHIMKTDSVVADDDANGLYSKEFKADGAFFSSIGSRGYKKAILCESARHMIVDLDKYLDPITMSNFKEAKSWYDTNEERLRLLSTLYAQMYHGVMYTMHDKYEKDLAMQLVMKQEQWLDHLDDMAKALDLAQVKKDEFAKRYKEALRRLLNE